MNLGFRLTNQRVSEIVDIWKKIQNANIITLRDVFATKEFNGEHCEYIKTNKEFKNFFGQSLKYKYLKY